MAQGLAASSEPHCPQIATLADASAMASAKGANRLSRFFNKCNATRRAERGPNPGNLASNSISRSISGLAVGVRGRRMLASRRLRRRQNQATRSRMERAA